jgi:Kef-type K+ transport system membrane component KefB/predicted amino acid-binding ACT domain protein
MDLTTVLTDILIVLVAAKVAAEVAERLGIPAVVGEILAGILVGPSVLGMVGHHDEVLRTLGEIGVILLLLEVGMEMDIGELAKVGRASLLVAVVGVVVPMVLGLGAMELMGEDFNTSLFIGAALTATSVGITARVFGDLGALATTEARVVLGAAVADDVMGLVVLTVVVRLVTEGSVSILSVFGIIGVALLFLVAGSGVGLRLSGPLFATVARFSRSTGTMVALALAFTLGFALLADAAKLAPIVGAFVAGLALTRSDQSGRIHRELAPVGHLFIPVFFLQIGIDADIGAFGRATVLRDAAILLAVAVVGKLVSPAGAIGTVGDKLLIGIGMLPRGEVGLIFATIGLANGVLNDDLYASLLVVVLVTTLATPQILKWRYSRLHARPEGVVGASESMPPGGWLGVADGVVELTARPPASAAVQVGLQAAVAVGRFEAGPLLVEWLAALPSASMTWRPEYVDDLLDVIERGNARSWRFLHTVGVLRAAFPEVSDALLATRSDPFTIDPLGVYRFDSIDRLRRLDPDDPVAVEASRLLHPDRLLLALFLVETLDGALDDPVKAATAVVRRLGLDPEAAHAVLGLVADRDLLWAAALRSGGLVEENVVALASHLETPERARALDVLSALLGGDRVGWEQRRLRDLHGLVQEALSHDELNGEEARDLIGIRRAQAIELVAGPGAQARILDAPRAYVVRQGAEDIARHAELVSPPLRDKEARVHVAPADGDGSWLVEVGTQDRRGLLAAVTGVLAGHDLDVVDAVVATWPDGAALESFRVASTTMPDAAALERDLGPAFVAELASPPLPEVEVRFDDHASPWHTVCELSAPDKPGLLHIVATGFAAARVVVVAATISASDGRAEDRFELVDRNGGKLDAQQQEAVRQFLLGGVATRHRFLRRPGVTTVGV